jgi:hypothetical protein
LFIKNFVRPSIELLDVVDEMERFAKERNYRIRHLTILILLIK